MGETPTILQGLPAGTLPNTQAALNDSLQPPSGNDYSGANRGPVTPGTNMPLPPNQAQTAQGEMANPSSAGADAAVPMHPVDKLANAFMDYVTKKDLAVQPTPPPPGSFGSKLAGAASALGAGLGDMRTGGNPAQGHGWLGAVGATLNARNERVSKEKQQKFENDERLKNDQINLANANMNMVTHSRNLQFQNDAVQDKAATSLSSYYDTLRDNYHVQDHVSQNDLNEMMKDPEFARHHTGGITGYEDMLDAEGKPVLNKQTGLPVRMPLYSVVDLGKGEIKEQYKVPADVAKKWSDAGIKNISAGTVMPVSMSTKLNSEAEKWGTSLNILNLDKIRPLPDDVKDQMSDALKNEEVHHAIAMNPGDVLGGLFQAQNTVAQHLQVAQQQLAAAQQSGNPQALKAAQDNLTHVQTVSQDVDQVITSGFTDAERKDYVKAKQAESKQDALDEKNQAAQDEKNRNDAERNRIEWYKAHNPNGAAGAVGGGASGDIPISDGMSQHIDQLRAANPSAAAVLDHYDNSTKGALMSVAFGDGSVDFKTVFPANLRKGVPGLSAKDAVNVLKQINPNWSESMYKQVQVAYKDATTGKNGQAIQQYNNFIQHSSEAVDALASANRKGSRVWNEALNKLQNAGYGTDATKIQAALSGPRGEISLLLSGGYKPGEAEQKTIDTIMSDASTPGQLSAALQQYAILGTVRLDNINENYKRTTGKNLPRIIDQKTLDAAKHLGVEKSSLDTLQSLDSSGTIYGPQTPAGANLPPLPKAPQGKIAVQIPGKAVGFIDPQALPKFRTDYPNARVQE
jgi:hypothetical protein